jgi:hypothetical protein
MALNSFPGVAETTSVNNRVYRATASGTYTVDVKPGVYRVSRQATTNIILGGNTITPSTIPSMVFISTATTSITFNSTVSQTLVPWVSAPAVYDGSAVGNMRLDFINNEFLATPTGVAQQLWISTDGRAWVKATNQGNLAHTFTNIVKGPTYYITGLQGPARSGNGIVAWSTNARLWSTRNVNAAQTFYTALFGNGMHIWAGYNGVSAGTGQVYYAADPSVSADGPLNLLSAEAFTAGAFGAGLFVLGGSKGSVRTSTNGTTWTARDPLFGSNYIYRIVYANNLFVAAGQNGTVRVSTDGITWQSRNPGFTTAFNLGNITYDPDEGIWVVGDGAYTELRISTDTVTWSVRSTPTTYSQYSMAYGNGNFVYTQYVDNNNFRPYTVNSVVTINSTVPFTDTYIMLDFKGQIETLV